MRVNGTLVEDKMCRFKGECEHFSFNKCAIYTHDGASAKFNTNSQEMVNSVHTKKMPEISRETLLLRYHLAKLKKLVYYPFQGTTFNAHSLYLMATL